MPRKSTHFCMLLAAGLFVEGCGRPPQREVQGAPSVVEEAAAAIRSGLTREEVSALIATIKVVVHRAVDAASLGDTLALKEVVTEPEAAHALFDLVENHPREAEALRGELRFVINMSRVSQDTVAMLAFPGVGTGSGVHFQLARSDGEWRLSIVKRHD